MKPFNLEEAKAGKPVCTRNGLSVRILCFDRLEPNYPIVALVKSNNAEEVLRYTKVGNCSILTDDYSKHDLFMKTEKKIGFVVLYNRDGFIRAVTKIFSSEEEISNCEITNIIAIIPIEWEE